MDSRLHSFIIFLLVLRFFLITAVSCNEGSYFFYQQPIYPRDCKDVYGQCSSNNSSGVYTIKPDGYPKPFEVFCDNDMSSGGWIVIQRQIDGSLEFKRSWEEYRNGFGFLSNEFYIGNEKLSYLTNQASYELRIEMVLSNGSNFYIGYKKFRISDEWSRYIIVTADQFSGNTSCVATSCPIGTYHGTCSCHSYCRNGTTYCYEICEETCIPKGCFVNEADTFIMEGETYTDPACTKTCNCTEGELRCDTSYQCDVNAVCQNRSGSYHQCYCNEGYSGDGVSCHSLCSANELYGTCTCQKSCANPTGCVSCNSGKGCYCPYGFYLQDGNCVPQRSCGCFFEGRILRNGETSVNSDCSRRCTCSNNQLICDRLYRCTTNAGCRVHGGVRQCYCNTGYVGDGTTSCRPYTDCNDAQNAGQPSGVYSIRPTGWTGSAFNVYCNMTVDGGGWTVIQRRMDGSQNFFLYWSHYSQGFGSPNRELWLGNDKLHYLTAQRNYQLRVDLVNRYGSPYYAKYSYFSVANAGDKYRLSVGGYRGNAGNNMFAFNGRAFTTRDRDNDAWSAGNCATFFHTPCGERCSFNSGWWFNACDHSLNAPYGTNCLIWSHLPESVCNVKYTEMKIRRV